MRSQDWRQLVGRIIQRNICQKLVMKESSIFNARNSTSSQSLCCVWERSIIIRNPTKPGRSGWITSSQNCRDFNGISGEPTQFEWKIFPRFDTLQLYGKMKDLLSRLGETPENFTKRILLVSMFNVISCGTKGNKDECVAHMQGSLVQENDLSFVLVPKRSDIRWKKKIHKHSETVSRKRCCWNSPNTDARFSVLRPHCLEVNSKAKDMENCRFTLQLFKKRLRLFSHHFWKPTHSTRNSRRDVWRTRISSRKNGATCCDGAINRAQCDQDRIFFGKWWPCTSKISTNMKNELKLFTTRLIE